jgi:hypothetical protein
MSKTAREETEHGYRRNLRELQIELVKFQRQLIKRGDRILVLIEGRDGAPTARQSRSAKHACRLNPSVPLARDGMPAGQCLAAKVLGLSEWPLHVGRGEQVKGRWAIPGGPLCRIRCNIACGPFWRPPARVWRFRGGFVFRSPLLMRAGQEQVPESAGPWRENPCRPLGKEWLSAAKRACVSVGHRPETRRTR